MIGPRQLASRLRPLPGMGMLPIRFRRRPKRLPRWPIARKRKVYGGIGGLQVRLALTRGDMRRAQRLRYQVFYEEMAAVASRATRLRRRDEDAYDTMCDHLLVIDNTMPRAAGNRPWSQRGRVVGTYRLLRQAVAERYGGFYTQGEFDIAPLVAAKPEARFVELGRSCVLKPYRTRRTVELLWHGLWTYVREHKMDVMIGCASFEGTDPDKHAMALSFLYHHALAPQEWRVRAHAAQHVEMNRMPKDAIDGKAALKALPPLIKGYLRVGAFVGDGAVIDRQFNTVDVMMIMPVSAIDPRYFAHFGAPGEAASAVAQKPLRRTQ